MIASLLHAPTWAQYPCVAAAEVTDDGRTSARDKLSELDKRGIQLLIARDNAAALPLYHQSLDLACETLGPRDPLTIQALQSYAFVLRSVGRDEEAEPLFRQLLGLSRDVFGAQHPDTIQTLSDHADVLDSIGRSAEAASLYEEALALRREVLGNSHPDTLTSLFDLAGILIALGRFAAAEPLQAEALLMSRAVLGEHHPDTMGALSDYAYVLTNLGRTDQAEPLFAEVLRLRREKLGERHPSTLISMSNYAAMLMEADRFKEAEPILAEVLRLNTEVLGPRHVNTLASQNNYAGVLENMGRLPEASELYGKTIEIQIETIGINDLDTISTINNYAYTLSRMGRSSEVEPLFEELYKILKKNLGDENPETMSSLHNYASLLMEIGRHDKAAPLFVQLLNAQGKVLGDNHPDTLRSLRRYFQLLARTSNWNQALDVARRYIVMTRQQAVEPGRDSVKSRAKGAREIGYRQADEALFSDILWSNRLTSDAGRTELELEAFIALQMASAGTASNAVKEAAALRFAAGQGLESLVSERRALINDWTRTEEAIVARLIGGGQARADREVLEQRLSSIQARITAIDKVLAERAPQYFAILREQSVGIGELRQILAPEEAVLFLVPTADGTHSMVVTRETIRWERAAAGEDAIGEAVVRLRKGLEIEEGNLLSEFDLNQAYELYSTLIASVEDALAGRTRVYVVAEGALSQLPLGTLVTRPLKEGADANDNEVLRTAGWLADRYALVQLPSLQSLVYIRRFGNDLPARDGAGLLGFGDPQLDGKARLRGARSATLGPINAADLVNRQPAASGSTLMDPAALRRLAALPGTRAELERVRDALGAPAQSLYLAERMTEANLRNAELSRTRILHLASHGFTSEESGDIAEPGVVFTPPGTARADDDGYLAASEVVGLDLRLAEWVILSACNTASPSGRPQEAGLSGLAQSFFYAGAKSLLVSHWPVFDDIAPVLTVGVLKRTQMGQPRAEALQAAMQDIRNNPSLDAAHPAVWAPFTLVGEGR